MKGHYRWGSNSNNSSSGLTSTTSSSSSGSSGMTKVQAEMSKEWDMAERLTLFRQHGKGETHEVTPAAYNEDDGIVTIWHHSLPDAIEDMDADDFRHWELVITVNGETYSGIIYGTDEHRGGDVYTFSI